MVAKYRVQREYIIIEALARYIMTLFKDYR